MQDENQKENNVETGEDVSEPSVDEVSFEPEDNETRPAGFGRSKEDPITKLKEEIKRLRAEKQEYLDLAQRTKADFVNLRKRDEEEKRELVKFANERLIEEILPVLDSFQMAFANKEAWEKADKNWRTGVEHIYAQLKAALAQNGLNEINPAGQQYDPARDEAVETVRVESEADDGKVLEVVRVGYELHGKEVRAPKVRIGHFEK